VAQATSLEQPADSRVLNEMPGFVRFQTGKLRVACRSRGISRRQPVNPLKTLDRRPAIWRIGTMTRGIKDRWSEWSEDVALYRGIVAMLLNRLYGPPQ
jgi:hypothetical protein